MSEEIIHTYRGSDCSRGHRFTVKFKSGGNALSWVKVCRKCGVTDVIAGEFDSNGVWRKKSIDRNVGKAD